MSKFIRGKPTLLYVDDNGDDHFLFQHSAIRTETPFHIQPFFSGAPVLAYLKGEAPFDDRLVYPWPALLLCDYDLGTTRGHDVVSQVRAIPSCRALPVIMFSGADGEDSAAKCYEAGADHFLHKPSAPQRRDIIIQTLYACVTARPRCFDSLKRLPEYAPRSLSIQYQAREHRTRVR